MRPAVRVFDKRMQPQELKFQNERPSKSTQCQQIRHLRQDSRTKEEKEFIRKLYQFKQVKNDDVMVVIKSKERGTTKVFTTSAELQY